MTSHRSIAMRSLIDLVEAAALQLPPIPADHVRLTHFTGDYTATLLLHGSPFRFKRISSTTDSFSDNQRILSLITTGEHSGLSRSGFGNSVVLMDVSNQEFRALRSEFVKVPEVDNSRIVGVVDRKAMRFIPNPNYNPNKPINIEQRNPTRDYEQDADFAPSSAAAPQPAAASTGPNEVF